ncbi:MAG: CocE/NonD family hydrolase [Solirubrobacteraceae bacterium]
MPEIMELQAAAPEVALACDPLGDATTTGAVTLASEVLARRMGLPRAQTLDVAHVRDLPVAMDDGVVLLADRFVARADLNADRRPTVLVRSPYGRTGFVGLVFGRLLAERGLQVVVQSVRGTFGSGGSFSPFDERADGLATLRWLRSQRWHSGRVATIGPSYLGLVQWAIAASAGEDLTAMSVHATASQFHGQTYAGGSLSLENTGAWMTVMEAQEGRLGPLGISRALRRLPEALAALPIDELDIRAPGGAVEWFRAALPSVARDGPYWAARDFEPSVPSVTAPVQFIGGWYDILLPWMVADFEVLQAAGRSPQLVVGPWAHTSPGMLAAGLREGLGWMRAHLLDDRRMLRGAPIRLMVTGERPGGGWRDLARWPPASNDLLLFASAGGELRQAAHPEGASDSGGDRYRYDPADPTPSLGGPVLLSRTPVVDNSPLEARADVLTYTGPVLEHALEVIGYPSVRLWVRASQPHFDLFARVCDVDRAGVSRNVCDALQRVDGSPRAADGTFEVSFQLWPMAHRFAAGHRIRLQVSSGAHPRYARNPGTGEDPLTATLGSMRAVEIELLRDAEHPSAVALPVIAPG